MELQYFQVILTWPTRDCKGLIIALDLKTTMYKNPKVQNVFLYILCTCFCEISPVRGHTKQCQNFRTIYGSEEISRNRVVIPARQATSAGGINSLESISGFLKSLKIPAQYLILLPLPVQGDVGLTAGPRDGQPVPGAQRRWFPAPAHAWNNFC